MSRSYNNKDAKFSMEKKGEYNDYTKKAREKKKKRVCDLLLTHPNVHVLIHLSFFLPPRGHKFNSELKLKIKNKKKREKRSSTEKKNDKFGEQ